MKSLMRFARCLVAVAAVVGFGVGCGGDNSSAGGGGEEVVPPFNGGSDALDGHYIGQLMLDGQALGLVMKVDQNKYLVYGPITIGLMAGNFKGSFSGNDITFKAEGVTGGGKSGDFFFTGKIRDNGDTLSGSYTAVVNGLSKSGSWSVQR
jgi:hypothetical protein